MLNETKSRLSRIIRGILSGKIFSLVLGFLLIIGLAMSSSLMAQSYSGGSGTSGDPYQIANKADLKYLSENSGEWGKYFKQTADINFIAGDFQSGGDFYNSGYGFIPIGEGVEVGTLFTGSYDGQNHTIDGLFINQPSNDFIGFFGGVWGGEPPVNISNIGLTNVNITGSYSVAGLAASCDYVSISNCYTTGSINGNYNVGGLVGWHGSTSSISNCYSNCTVIETSQSVGGLIGRIWDASVTNSYATGSVSGTSDYIGGLVGRNYSSTVNNCFWDTQTSGQDLSAGGTGKTTAEMKTLATFTDVSTDGLTTAWDFETNPNDDAANNNYWDMDLSGTTNSGYPYLSWEDGEDVSLPVELTSFTATAGDGQVTLRWATESEIENLGFNIYRNTNSNVKFLMINDELIQGAGNSSSRHEYKYVDKGLTDGIKYWYKLEDVDYSGNTELHGPVSATPIKSVPKEFCLHPNYPNPFNPETTISYDLSEDGFVELSVYNMRGEKVTTLIKGNQEAGSYRLNWDGTNRNGEIVSSGIYFLRIASGSYSRTSKMVFIR